MGVPSLLDMLKAGVHFGHLTSRWHPKMAPFIFTARSGVHIINLEVTRQQLETAFRAVSDVVAAGGIILYVGTKKQAQEMIKRKAQSVEMPYVHERWIGGLLTNFGVIKKMLTRHAELGRLLTEGGMEHLTKKERLEREREHRRLEGVIGGISKLEKIPNLIFIIDLKREKTALREARKAGVPIVALCDTNVNPELVTYPIVANDDAIGSLELMTDLITEAVKEGLSRRSVEGVEPSSPEIVQENVEAPVTVIDEEVLLAEGIPADV
ncbi:30S ribosomal protein S2 [Candidatus Uhrbacteria bacterium RIFCSPLOWO2_12_FULL_46_10]|uniref:Small ribosomal subunit protein uS2 n=1 Tax=Candidatus Uhrbacteria bacterium RIFCSPLOWO2_01_FULL_47_25 TaxID=1802402 RepID=A0A1F7UYA0_9BACT|nr:MAG: 30S ribosomal protein S2 [Candidatus Uhrbacteria bacterium RIFCSPHIGHO2_01_FULL_46_23]OGL69673.1 MAG: 30S ribosomal protein S2 [Candidatus Uhrbacteria bacterium RIFCSPHIGHO2_02_FULL_47_29]OGL75895.1 MAG: 30S ribosomal protein S2 [Candidatus Uhrbacteria bacterium RIFCSPHIGHO2_12_FULL_46_13]OGL82734.1 MAG: 30S ribosomal protein S2 [Candidatus Uhrbacteria bacterium RIFCSPLOWO2_01_FULL_47_25]OGL86846.1 MAG: 30S ribosomal protein S2 [Candidatus Uhrbacteria bacterium RIFCSPLOWO2_02_FULL_46_19